MGSLANQIVTLALALATLALVWFVLKPRRRPVLRSVAILVLGDIGRSPRMMYHAESFATNGFETYLIGYAGSKPIPSLLSIPHVHFLYLMPPPLYLTGLPFIIGGPRKVLHQVLSIVHTLCVRIPQPPEFILVQNPPSIPTLAIVWIVSKLRGSKVIIDWHNLGYSILALRLGKRHPFVKIAKLFEAFFGRSAYAHLFVTHAMRDFLVQEWGLKGQKAVLHDRPPSRFHRASPSETHELFLRLRASLSVPTLTSFLPPYSAPYSTPFTSMPRSTLASSESGPMRILNGPPNASTLDPEPIPVSTDTDPLAMSAAPMPAMRSDRPALIVSSTSWTPDEDFGLLLDALILYERRACELSAQKAGSEKKKGLPKLLVVVTGKGPLREKYMTQIGKLQDGEDGKEPWRFVRCVSMWLEAEDYPLLLGSADVGVSLHSSSSALDLPMKVVDMFGCGLPVCALGFACLDELVKDGLNGLVFHNAEQLAAQLETLLASHPSSAMLDKLRASLIQSMPLSPSVHSPPASLENLTGSNQDGEWTWSTWAQNWDRVVRPLVLRDARSDGI